MALQHALHQAGFRICVSARCCQLGTWLTGCQSLWWLLLKIQRPDGEHCGVHLVLHRMQAGRDCGLAWEGVPRLSLRALESAGLGQVPMSGSLGRDK